LHTGAGNKNAFKALIAAEYSGVKVEVTKNFEMGVSNKTPEFLKMNPLGKVHHAPIIIFELLCIVVHELKITLQVPVLETPDGPVFESNAIARYGIYRTPHFFNLIFS